MTTRLEFVTSVLVLPQRSTPLVAKQAAEVDLLSGGRLRLAVGVGWNFLEYESLNADFETRNRRLEEQIVVLRKLWTEPLVRLRALLVEAGRDPSSFGLDARILGTGGPADWVAAARRWRALGATNLCLSAGRGIPAPQQLELAIRMKQALADVI